MTVKQTTSYTDEAYQYAQALVETGEFGSVSAAASAALVRMKEAREREQAAFEAEILRRAALPADQWIPWEPGDLLRDFQRRRADDTV